MLIKHKKERVSIMRDKKKIITLVLTLSMAVGSSMSVFADWQETESGLKWQNEDGSHPINEWKWIDRNGDGMAECYYFNENGDLLVNTITPAGCQVNAEGAWVVDGVVQTQAETNTVQQATGDTEMVDSKGYDPAHPLANAPEEWNLRLTPDKNFINYHFLSDNDNIHAMLTGQMEYYHRREDGMGENANQPDLNTREQELYEWYCNWLNSIDFMNMTEMERARAIKDVLAQSKYESSNVGEDAIDADYAVLIHKIGICGDFTITTMHLARALGLKSSIEVIAGHSWAYIYVDGKTYKSENGYVDLETACEDIANDVWHKNLRGL